MEQSGRRVLRLLALTAGLLLVAWAGWRGLRTALAADGVPAVRRVVPADLRVRIEVLNGSGRRGAARLATRTLRQAGFDVVYFGNAAEEVDSTLVLVRRGEAEPAGWARRALGVGVVREAPDTLRRVELSVVIGPDWRPPPEFVPLGRPR